MWTCVLSCDPEHMMMTRFTRSGGGWETHFLEGAFQKEQNRKLSDSARIMW
jgi:hypothetical protein